MANADIRYKSLESGVPHWKIARRLGIDASTLSRRLRNELPEAEKAKILKAIEEEAGENEKDPVNR